MDRNLKKFGDKTNDKNTKDRGDLRKILLSKEFEDLTINDFRPAHDRGDSRSIHVKTQHVGTPQRQLNSKLTNIYNGDKNTVTGTRTMLSSASKKMQKATKENKERGDVRRKEQNAKVRAKEEVDLKKIEVAKAKTSTLSQELRTIIKEHNATIVAKKEIETKKTEELEGKTIPLCRDVRKKEHNAKFVAKKEVLTNKTEELKPKTTSLTQEVRRKELNAKFVATREVDKKTEEVKAKTMLLSQRKDTKSPAEKSEEQDIDQFNISEKDLDKKLGGAAKAKISGIIFPRKVIKNSDEPQVQNRTYLDLEGRKLLREKYTVKLKNNHNVNKNSDDQFENYKGSTKIDDRDIKKQTDGETTEKLKTKESKDYAQPETTKPSKASREVKTPVEQRKPMIKTVKMNQDNRVYKAVTFVDQKESTPLQIKIPIHFKKERKSCEPKLLMQKIANESIISKQTKAKKKDKNRLLKARIKSDLSPLTEVAQWAPSCVDDHTKPYYEAWVNITLAATTKCSEEEMFTTKKNVFETYKRLLHERPSTPDLICENLNDERYTGRIRVRRHS